jgi:glycosyltransferase involved in cell wall biosynthesis
MKILVVTQYYYPEQFNINLICESLVKQGNIVTVLTGLPNYPTGKIPAEYKWFKKRNEIINGVKIIRTLEVGRKPGFLGLALNYFSFMISASIKAITIKKDFDIIFVYQLSPITLALPAVVLKKISGKPLYLYCLDIWPESAKNLIKDSNCFIFKSIKLFSRFIYNQCDHISVTTDTFIGYFKDTHNLPEEKLSVIPQQGIDEYINMVFTTDNDCVNFVFMGNVGISQSIYTIIDAAALIKDQVKFKVNIVGDGSYMNKIKNDISLKGLEDIFVFHGRHQQKDMPNFYKIADACLLTLDGSTLIGETVPSKLQGYMAAGKPVLAAINGAAKRIILESKCGAVVEAGDSEGFSLIMKEFIDDPKKYSSAGKNGKEYYLRHFTEEIFLRNLQNNMIQLIEEMK